MRNVDAVDEIIAEWSRVRPELDVSPMGVFGPLHRCFLLYRAQITEIFARYDTNEAGFDVLACLRRAAPQHRRTAGQLAEATLVTTGGLTLRVNRLVKAGLVVRVREGSDARVVYVQLTEKGKELVDAVADVHFAHERQMIKGLNAKDQKELGRLLRRLELSLRATAASQK